MNTPQALNGAHSAAALMAAPWPATLTPEQKLQRWLDAGKALAEAKAAEAEARLSVVDAFPFDEDIAEGTQRLPLAGGYQLKVVKKLNYKLSNDDNVCDQALTKIEKLDAEGAFIAERLVKWSPSLSVSEYRDLPNRYREILDEVLTVTAGMPTLELIEPKGKK